MRSVVSLFLPTWPCDRVRRKNAGVPPCDCPMVTVMQEGNRRVIAAADEAARRIKLHPGMTLAHAQSLVPDLHVVEAARGKTRPRWNSLVSGARATRRW